MIGRWMITCSGIKVGTGRGIDHETAAARQRDEPLPAGRVNALDRLLSVSL